MTRDPLRRRMESRHKPFELDELNHRTTLLHAACIASGGHTPSDVTVMRDGTEMVVCGRCRVPGDPGARTWKRQDMYREAARRGGAAKHGKAAA